MMGKKYLNYRTRFQRFIAHTDLIASDEHFLTLVAEIRQLTDPLIDVANRFYVEVLNFMFFEVTYEEMDLFVSGLFKIVHHLLALKPTSWFNEPIAAVNIISRLETTRRGALKLLALFVHPQEYYSMDGEGREYYDDHLRKIDSTLDTFQTVIFQIMDKAGSEELLQKDTDSGLMRFLLQARASKPVEEATLENFAANLVGPQLMQKVLSPEIKTWYKKILREEDVCTLCGHRIEEDQLSDCMLTAGCEHPYCGRCMPRLQRSIDSLCKVPSCEKEMQYYTSMRIVLAFQKYTERSKHEAQQKNKTRLAVQQLLASGAQPRNALPKTE